MFSHAVTEPAQASQLSLPLAALTAAICAFWIFPGLVGHDPWKPDEAFTFGVIYEILNGGSWVVPTLAGEVFLGAPPLFHLTAAFLARLLSPLLPLHGAARLASGRPDDLAELVPEYVTLPRGIPEAAGEVR